MQCIGTCNSIRQHTDLCTPLLFFSLPSVSIVPCSSGLLFVSVKEYYFILDSREFETFRKSFFVFLFSFVSFRDDSAEEFCKHLHDFCDYNVLWKKTAFLTEDIKSSQPPLSRSYSFHLNFVIGYV